MLSQPIRDELSKLVGERLDPNKAEQIQDQIADELGPRFYVARRVARGSNRQFIVVIYDVRRVRLIPFAAQPPQHILYHSKQNFSAIAHLPIPLGEGNRFTFGLADDQDLLLERFAGFNTAFEMTNVGTNHVGLALRYSRYHERWQPATVDASPTSVYRERNNFEPSLTFAFDPRFRLTAGVNLSDLQMQYPAIHRANSNSAVGSLIFENVWRRGSEEAHSVRASYEFRTGTHELDSDFIYTRHLVSGQYQYAQDNKRLLLGLMAGTIAGNAPLFERFSLGNTSTLRGWNKFDIAPLGGNRVLHAVVQYGLGGPDIVTFNRARRSRIDFDLHVFYDVGVVGDRGTPMTAKHSVGFGFGSPGSSGFFLDLGFPIRSNRIQPIFMMGFRF
jgi:hypothetical protein